MQPPGYPAVAGTLPFRTEREMIRALGRRIAEIDPDILTGWNVIDFDLAVLLRMSERMGVPLKLGRGNETVRIRGWLSFYEGSDIDAELKINFA